MEEIKLILDLRENQCTTGLLVKGPERSELITGKIFDIRKDITTNANVYDPTAVADLSFYRELEGKAYWQPVSKRALRSGNSNKFEVIENLFEEPLKRLEKLLPKTLGSLLNCTGFKQYLRQSSSVLVLIDQPKIRRVLEDFLSKLDQPVHVRVISKAVSNMLGDMSGFALLDPDSKEIPQEGSSWLCEIRELPGKRQYTWHNKKFVFEVVDKTTEELSSVTSWKSTEELKRTGEALFALVWQERLSGVLRLKRVYKQVRIGLLTGLTLLLLIGAGMWAMAHLPVAFNNTPTPPSTVASISYSASPTTTSSPNPTATETNTPTPLPSPTPIRPRTIVTSNLRTGPSTDFTVVTVLKPGVFVLPIESDLDGTWWHVRIMGQDFEGWIHTDLLSGTVELRPIPTASVETRTTVASNLRAGPSTDFTVITLLEVGTVVSPIESALNDTWWRVEVVEQDIEGWIYTDLLSGTDQVGPIATASVVPSSPTPEATSEP